VASVTAKKNEPPPGPPWDLPIDEATFAFVDLEMTGLDAEKDRVCEACVIRAVGTKDLATLETLVMPDARVGGNAKVHGLDLAALEGAPSFREIAPRVAELLDGAIVVAHGVTYDLQFLEAELGRAGVAMTNAGSLDTLTLSRRAFQMESHRLSSLATALGITLDRPHRAGDDARATKALFFRAVAILSPTTPRDLWHVRIGEKHARPEVLAHAVQAAEENAEVIVRYRPSRRPPEELRMVITEVRTDLDPPRVLGYLLPGRGRKELRADRILALSPAI
jgi:DNA polymerase-3 subunit epsilon